MNEKLSEMNPKNPYNHLADWKTVKSKVATK